MPTGLLTRSFCKTLAPAIALVPLLGALSACVTSTNTNLAVAPSASPPARTATRTVVLVRRPAPVFVAASGKRARLVIMHSLNPDCSLEGYMTVRVVVPPVHGTASVEQGLFYPNYPHNNPHAVCNTQPAEGMAAFYQSATNYVGPDYVEMEVIEPDGRAGRLGFHIDVR